MKHLQRLNYYQVEAIRDAKTDSTGKRFYLVKWKDWEERFNTWEPLNNLQTVKTLIKDFEQSREVSKQANAEQGNHQQKPNKFTPNAKDKQDGNGEEQPGQPTEKRQKGRPKLVRPPDWVYIRKKKTQIKKEETPEQPTEQKQQIDIKTKSIPVLSPTLPQTQQPLPSLPNEETVCPSRRMGLMRRRRQIRKDRVSQRLVESIRKESKDQPVDKKQQQSQEQEEQNEHQSLAESNDSQEDELGIEQVLLKCKNYTYVKVSLKNNTFFYDVPYEEGDKARSIVLTAQQILKVNPKWLEGYFQGFFL